MPRTDAHTHAALKPDDYTWVGYSDDGDANTNRLTDGILFPAIGAPAANELRREANPSGVRNEIHPGGCDACGQMGLRYRHYFRHDPTGDVIVLGDQCVARMDFPSAKAFDAAKKIRKQRELEALKAEREEWEAENKEVAIFLTDVKEERKHAGGSQFFVVDVANKLHKYGSLSERQTAAIQKIMERAAEREVEREAENLIDIPETFLEGRHKITGQVVSYKWKDDGPFSRYVMTVKDDRGFKVWGTAPTGLVPEIDLDTSEATGDPHPRVSFYATIKVSDRDKTFGFFKRPTKSEVLETV